jgi:hypothetical protein
MQSLQTTSDIAPVFVEYFPAPHSWQVSSDTAPLTDEYLPDPQLKHSLSLTAPYETNQSTENPGATSLPSVENSTFMIPVEET